MTFSASDNSDFPIHLLIVRFPTRRTLWLICRFPSFFSVHASPLYFSRRITDSSGVIPLVGWLVVVLFSLLPNAWSLGRLCKNDPGRISRIIVFSLAGWTFAYF